MAKLELPIRSFIESFCKAAFPDRDWSRGTAINDLVIKAFSSVMQPLRQDIDAIKVGQSVTNWRYMTTDAMDKLAANWGKFRQSGSRATGTVRLYFDSANQYSLTYLEFYTTDGTTFLLAAPVTITSTDLLKNRQSDGGYYYDVAVISQGVGNAYALPAGSLVGIRNPPTGIVSVQQLVDFTVTAPDETNFDVVNSLYKNLGLRNFVSKQSIRAPIFDSFPGVRDVYVTGAGDPKMLRDLVSFDAGSGIPTTIHVGGMTDVWVNTINLNSYQTVFSYLPSSGILDLVSAKQAQTSQVLFTDATSVVTTDGSYLYGGTATLDESAAVVYDQNGLAVNAFPIGNPDAIGRYTVANQDLILGTDLLVLPSKGGSAGSQVIIDPLGTSFGSAGCRVGDTFIWKSTKRRITDLAERSIRLAPAAEGLVAGSMPAAGVPFSVAYGAGTRTFAHSLSTPPPVGSRLVVTKGSGRGHYKVLGNPDSTHITIGNVKAAGALVPYAVSGTTYTYQYRGAASIPASAAYTGTFSGATVTTVGTTSVVTDATLGAHAVAGQVLIAGSYSGYVIAVASSQVTLDTVIPAVTGAYSLYTPTYAAPQLPSNFNGPFTALCTAVWAPGTTLPSQNPNGFYQVAVAEQAVVVTSVARSSSGVFFASTTPFFGVQAAAAVLVEGFHGAVAIGDTWYAEADSAAFDASYLSSSYSNTNTFFTSSLTTTLVAGSDRLIVPGIGRQSNPGDLVVFENPGTLSAQQLMESGTDGKLWTTYVGSVLDDNTITLGALLPVDIPPATRYAIQRNQRVVAVSGTFVGTVTSGVLAQSANSFTFPTVGAGAHVAVGDRIAFNYSYHSAVPPPYGTTYQYEPTITAIAGDTVTLSPPVPGGAAYGGSGYGGMTGGIPSGTAFTVYHDSLALTSLRVTSASKGGLAISIAANGALPTWPQGLGDGSGLVLRITDPVSQAVTFNHIRYVTGSVTRTLSFNPPVSVVNVTLSGSVSTLPGDVGQAVTQMTTTGVTARGVLKAYNNTTGVWTIAPNSGADVFVSTAGNTIAVAGRTPYTVTTVSAATTFGYVAPAVGDIGKTVVQGTYRGTLLAYNNTNYTWSIQPFADTDVFDDVHTTVFVDSNADGVLTSGEANGTLRIPSVTSYANLTGTIGITLNSPFPFSVTALPGTLYAGDVPECYVDVLSRIPLTGALVDGTYVRLAPDSSLNPDNLSGVASPSSENLVVPVGDNVGRYFPTGIATSTYTLPSALADLYLSIPNSPGALTVTTVASAGATTLTFTGSGLGFWAYRGRALRMTVNGATRYYALLTPQIGDSSDMVRLDASTPLQTPIASTSIVVVEIVHGYVMPFFRALPAGSTLSDGSLLTGSYRVIRPPTLAETEVTSTQGVQSATTQQLTDATQNFTSLIGYTDSAVSALEDDWLNLDSGADASLVPKTILSVPYSSALQLDPSQLTVTASGIQYHISRRSNDVSAEGWFAATVQNNTIVVADPDPTNSVNPVGHAAWVTWSQSVIRYYTASRWNLHVTSDPTSSTAWEVKHLPIASAVVIGSTVTFTIDSGFTNASLQPSTGAGVWTAGTGFTATLTSARVSLRAADRVMSRNVKAIGVETYNYYLGNYLTLPLVRILAVELLDQNTLQPVRTLDYTFVVPSGKAGLRYSSNEQNRIIITDPDAYQKPVRLTYVADSSIEGINNFLTSDDVRVLDANQLVKRMETIAVDLTVTVRSTLTSQELVTAIAGYINALPSTTKVSKDGVIQYLYANGSVTGVDTSSFVLAGTYYPAENGVPVVYTNVSEVFGAPTACYLAGNISVTVAA